MGGLTALERGCWRLTGVCDGRRKMVSLMMLNGRVGGAGWWFCGEAKIDELTHYTEPEETTS